MVLPMIVYLSPPLYPLVDPINTKSDQHLISPYSDTAESLITIIRIKEMIANLRNFDC